MQASQDVRRKANAVCIFTRVAEPQRVIGYFTLCATALAHGEVPEGARKHVPRYRLVSATLIGRLAMASDHHGRGLGGVLLARVLRASYASAATVGSCMVVVDAIDERAAAFYEAHGFARLPDSLRLVMAMRMIEKLVVP